jgi:hypothetical protein
MDTPKEENTKTNTLAIVALVFSFIFPPIGFILSIISLVSILKKEEKGLVIAIIALVLSIILAIVYIVAIGAFFMIAIHQTAEDEYMSPGDPEQIKCGSDVGVNVLTVNNKYRICLTKPTSEANGKMGIFLENTGLRDITGLRIITMGELGVEDKEINSSLVKGSIYSYKIEIDKTIIGEEIYSVSIAPKISTTGSFNYCIKPNLKWDQEGIDSFEDCNNATWYSYIK